MKLSRRKLKLLITSRPSLLQRTNVTETRLKKNSRASLVCSILVMSLLKSKNKSDKAHLKQQPETLATILPQMAV